MKYIAAIILINIQIIFALGQSIEITTEIKRNNYKEYVGTIGEFPIRMYLEIGGACGFQGMSSSWANRKSTGWYYYEKQKKKIPLIGYFNGGDGFETQKEYEDYKHLDYHRIELYVPKNYQTDTLDADCKMNNYAERFIQDEDYDFSNITWNGVNKDLPVKLSSIHSRGVKTNVIGLIQFNAVIIDTINLTKLFDKYYIEEVYSISIKEIEDDFHIITSFYERTIPGGSGGGYCGSGVEAYYGYLLIGKNWEVKKKELVQWHSCVRFIEEEYSIDHANPEFGIVKIE